MACSSEDRVGAAVKQDEFVFVEHNDSTLEALRETLKQLQNEVDSLRNKMRKREKFQEKFFELFIAFTVLVAPIAAAFAFLQMTGEDPTATSKEAEAEHYFFPCCPYSETDDLSSGNATIAAAASDASPSPLPPAELSAALAHLRQAVVFVLIAVSTFVGVPYYYYTMDDLCRHLTEDEDMARGGDEDEMVAAVGGRVCGGESGAMPRLHDVD